MANTDRFRRLGSPRTDEERWERHRMLYPDEDISELPPRGTGFAREGLSGAGRRMGKPRTDAERAAIHRSRYGTTDLPARGAGLGNAGNDFDWGKALMCGGVGLVLGLAVYAIAKGGMSS